MWTDGAMRVRNNTFGWWLDMAENGWTDNTIGERGERTRSTQHRSART
ncbi:MAG: hypothetical protein GF331_14695 [Chitinivibrionales bacterium]|nr:hypothetical protein [Chitinivibrionales bacterium]